MRNELFVTNTSAGADRIEALLVGLIEWWVEYGGLSEIHIIAENCDFQKMHTLRDDVVGQIVLDRHDYKQDFLEACRRDPTASYLLKLVWRPDVPEPSLTKDWSYSFEFVQERFSPRFKSTVGYVLRKSAWWEANKKRIQKEREDLKKVRHVMES